jgi:hypothetical protein
MTEAITPLAESPVSIEAMRHDHRLDHLAD